MNSPHSGEKRGFFKDWKAMIRAFKKDHVRTGSLMPSSRYLSRELTSQLEGSRGPCRILEVGPGTGPVTAQIIRLLQPQDQLDIVEINPEFVKIICKRFNLPGPIDVNSSPAHIRVLCTGIELVPGSHCYRHIISGLPLNNFTPGFVEEIFATFKRLLEPGGTISFFEYLAVRPVKSAFVNRDERKRLSQIGNLINQQRKAHGLATKRIFANLPPAKVNHLRIG